MRPPLWNELVADLYADPGYNPTTVVSKVHEKFKTVIDIGYNQVKNFSFPNADQAASRISGMRLILSRVVAMWEKSGAGDAGLNPASRNRDDDGDRANGDNDNAHAEAIPIEIGVCPFGHFADYEDGGRQLINVRTTYPNPTLRILSISGSA